MADNSRLPIAQKRHYDKPTEMTEIYKHGNLYPRGRSPHYIPQSHGEEHEIYQKEKSLLE